MAATAQANAVAVQIFMDRVTGIVQEMQNNLFRTGFSTIVRESQDASCLLLDRHGAVVGEHTVAPLHLGALPVFAQRVAARYDGDINSGDVFISNHPYLSGITHTPDLAVLIPIHLDATLIGFGASIGHKSDLGGMVPGTGYGDATEIFQEGLLIPCVRLEKAGIVVREIEDFLRANSREPSLLLGDMYGQVGTLRQGAERFLGVARTHGVQQVLELLEVVQDVARRRFLAGIADWSPGVYTGQAVVDAGRDENLTVRVDVTVSRDGLVCDFAASDDETTRPVNTHPSVVRGAVYFAALGLTDPAMANNGGIAAAIEVRTRPGSFLDPTFPAPTNSYIPTAEAIVEAVCSALAPVSRIGGIAESGCVGALTISGHRSDGSHFVCYELPGSAYGARRGLDGVSGATPLINNVKLTPVEIVEAEFPLRIEEFELICDSGGAGEFRGGLGFRRSYRFLGTSGALTLRGGKLNHDPEGTLGGLSGRRGRCQVVRTDGSVVEMPPNVSGVPLSHGDLVVLKRSGGGGIGNPTDRPRDQVVADVDDGFVSFEAAGRLYHSGAT